MPVKCEEYSQVCVLEVHGDLVAENVQLARASVEEHIEKRHIVDFVIDLQKTSFIDSDGLEALLWMKRRCEALFGQIKLVRLDENCQKVLEVTRLQHRFECHADLPTALKTMR